MKSDPFLKKLSGKNTKFNRPVVTKQSAYRLVSNPVRRSPSVEATGQVRIYLSFSQWEYILASRPASHFTRPS